MVSKEKKHLLITLLGLTPPIAHLDVKSPNVLLVSCDPNSEICAKLSDFGTSVPVTKPLLGTEVSNPVWLAPEILRQEMYDLAVDVYAFGVILWELRSLRDFFGEINFFSAIHDRIVAGKRPKIPPSPEKFTRLVSLAWVISTSNLI